MFRMLCEDLLELNSTKIVLAQDVRLSESEILIMLGAIKQLKKQVPIQYIIGHCEFYGLEILCDERALIPRPETEELVDWICTSHHDCGSILDIGTGTGCIPLAIKSKNTNCAVHAMDVSTEALELARSNAIHNKLDIHFHKDDILNPQGEYSRVEIIASNPPYIQEREKAAMNRNVLDYEPELALFVPDMDPLKFYKAVMDFAIQNLAENGWVYFEINEAYGKETADLMEASGFQSIEIKKDLNGKDRMVRGQRK